MNPETEKLYFYSENVMKMLSELKGTFDVNKNVAPHNQKMFFEAVALYQNGLFDTSACCSAAASSGDSLQKFQRENTTHWREKLHKS